MTPPSPGRGGVTSGDVLLALASLALVAALAYPRTERALLWRTVAAAQADVETIRAAAAAFRDDAGGWPAPAEAGKVPAEMAARLPPGFSFESGSYTLEWSRWERVDPPDPADPEGVVQPPPGGFEPVLPPPADSEVQVPVETLGAVTVHASDERVLAALLERFGPSESFVRERSWTLVLPVGGGG
ncbi:MAG TPA: hypothetical protein VLH75_10460 [Longimicrobiales bacterium]|nr:hypothetical protein [Longimicrobiales bacterium]